MGVQDHRIDAFIAKAQPFARPILDHLRAAVHAGCPDAQETIKWGMPFFMYKGSILCMMAAFKQHCTFGFWKAPGLATERCGEAMGQFGRITALKDLPPKKTLVAMVQEAARRKAAGVKAPPKPRPAAKKELAVPPYFLAAVKKNRKALSTFQAFPYSKKKDYVQWVTEAKGEDTRERRLKTTVEWLAEGKSRNWKYERA